MPQPWLNLGHRYWEGLTNHIIRGLTSQTDAEANYESMVEPILFRLWKVLVAFASQTILLVQQSGDGSHSSPLISPRVSWSVLF